MNIQFTEEFSNFSFSTLNCNGFKSSIDYIDYLSCRYDINFLCETWLRAGDICNIKEYFSHKWCHFVTSMNPTEICNSRPFGGMDSSAMREKMYIIILLRLFLIG